MAMFPVCLVLGLITTPTFALFFFNTGVVRPINPYVFIGDTLNLTCHVTDNDRFPGNVSELLYFTKMFGTEEKPIPEEYVTILDTRSILLEYPVTSGDDQGGYSCHLNSTTGEATYINSQRVTVEYRPVAVHSLDYLVYDWRNMTVTWDLGQEYVNLERVKVQLVWTIDGTGLYCCPHQKKTSCTWKENDGRDSFKNMPYYINVNVTTLKDEQSLEETTVSQSGWIYANTQHHVKPAPVENLTVVDRNSSCISVSWQQSQHSRFRTIVHRVILIDNVEVLQNISTESTNVTICDLQPANEYVVNVSCIPVPIGEEEPKGYYSDWRGVKVATLNDATSTVSPVKPSTTALTKTLFGDHGNNLLFKMKQEIQYQQQTILKKERMILDKEKKMFVERQKLLITRESLLRDREKLVADRESLTGDREKLVADRERLTGDREKLLTDRESVIGDREKLLTDRESVIGDREKLLTDRESGIGDREKLLTDRESVIGDREKLLTDRDSVIGDRQKQVGNRERLNKEL